MIPISIKDPELEREGLRKRIVRVRTEIAFIMGDAASGGPSQEAELARLRAELIDLTWRKDNCL